MIADRQQLIHVPFSLVFLVYLVVWTRANEFVELVERALCDQIGRQALLSSRDASRVVLRLDDHT